ncbi:MAG: universal stress protein [Bacteroidia bacterium]|nr:universal stress protein [Bacteroidia bacterium]
MKSDTESKLKKLRAELVSQGMDPGHITINTRNGHTVKEISRFADYVHGDLIITGMQGINRIRERLFGSTSYQLIRSTRVPVLAVPSGFEFRKIKKIVFASDGKKITPDSGRILFEIADHFGSTIDIVCIQSPGDYPSDDQVIALLAPVFSRTPHEFHFPGESDVVRGLLAYSDNIKPDLMVIIPGVHTAFFEIMKEHPAKSLMFRSAVPVLALPAGDR